MKKFSKNRKGFTLAEEVVTVVLIGVLVATSSGILMHAMRIFCRNVITLNAQEKGIAVMEQLEGNLEYATRIYKSSESYTITYPYQVQLSLKEDEGKQYLNAETTLKYSNTDTGHTAENQVCKLGTYKASYTVEDSGANRVKVNLKIERNGTVYYSDSRIIELKNSPNISGLHYDSEVATDGNLCIEGLE